jgi:pimeloyl-ACP methyl ester carboxylesterase
MSSRRPEHRSDHVWTTVPTRRLTAEGVTYAYRELGPQGGVPVVLLTHLAAVLDDWDPRVVDGLSRERHVIAFDNRGVGASSGRAPTTIGTMAADAATFVRALGHDQVDVVGFSLGGMIAQELVTQQPNLVRRLVLAGTGPAGGEGITRVTPLTYFDTLRGLVTCKDPKTYLFFTRTLAGRRAAVDFLDRLRERTVDRDSAITVPAFRAQLKAIGRWGRQAPTDLSTISIPVLVVNGESDRMVPTSNTIDLDRRLPDSQLVIYPDAGHGGIFQNHDDFVTRVLHFL